MSKQKQAKSSFKDFSIDELRAKEGELIGSLFKLKLQQNIGQLKDTSVLLKTRRDLARAKTFIAQKSTVQK